MCILEVRFWRLYEKYSRQYEERIFKGRLQESVRKAWEIITKDVRSDTKNLRKVYSPVDLTIWACTKSCRVETWNICSEYSPKSSLKSPDVSGETTPRRWLNVFTFQFFHYNSWAVFYRKKLLWQKRFYIWFSTKKVSWFFFAKMRIEGVNVPSKSEQTCMQWRLINYCKLRHHPSCDTNSYSSYLSWFHTLQIIIEF